MNDISGVYEPKSDTPRKRSGNPRISQVHPGALHQPLVEFDRPFILAHQVKLIVSLLPGDGILLYQGIQAL